MGEKRSSWVNNSDMGGSSVAMGLGRMRYTWGGLKLELMPCKWARQVGAGDSRKGHGRAGANASGSLLEEKENQQLGHAGERPVGAGPGLLGLAA